MASTFVFRRFALVFALGCSAEASTAVGGPGEGESMRTGSPEAMVQRVPLESSSESANAETQVLSGTATLWVNHYQEPCAGWEGKYLCNLVADSEDGPWVREYDSFGGIALEWGHVYEVELGFVDRGDVGPDAPSTATFVTAILTDHPVTGGSVTFEFPVDPQLGDLGYPYLTMTSADGGQTIDGTEFICDSTQVCAALETALGSDEPFVVRFGYGPELLPLVALSIDE